ncbi:MAG: 3-oxoacyl-[acyl-carrier protein] reductase [Paraglaciecola sp.]|jgi:3-oxoacyl-[acyl-carrier protein] reductase
MLADKCILITGANRGIGNATARLCAKYGARLFLGGRDECALQALAEELGNEAHNSVQPLVYDVCDENAVKQAFQQIQQSAGRLDALVNNAGIMLDATIGMTRLSDLQQQLNINTVAAFQHAQLASRLMTRQRSGSIINLCSAVGEQGSAGQSAYATSKAALSGMTKSMAKELGSLNIRVNGVAPGFIDTDMVSEYQHDKRRQVLENIALKRVGQADEVAELICFLLSEKATYISGQVIGIDGGIKL